MAGIKILLAVDSSSEFVLATKALAARPWPPGTTVEVLSVVERFYAPESPEGMDSVKQRAGEAVQAAAQRLRSSGIETTAIVLCGNPKGIIVEHARRSGTDFIVVGSHRPTTATQFLHSSVARAVVRFAPCSVEVVRAEAGAGAMKILLATDGSQYSEVAARSVAGRPWPLGTEVRIVSVVDHHLHPPVLAKRHSFEGLEKLEKEAIKRAQEAVLSAEKIIAEGHLGASGTIAVPSAPPKDLILKEAENCGAPDRGGFAWPEWDLPVTYRERLGGSCYAGFVFRRSDPAST